MAEKYQTQEQIGRIHSAIKFIASRCDHAVEDDGIGFNGADAQFGHDLARKEKLTFRQALAAQKMIAKYHRQLTRSGGFDMEELMAQVEEPRVEPTRNATLYDDGVFAVRFTDPDRDTFNDLITFVKHLGARFVKTGDGVPFWEVRATPDIAERLYNAGFSIDGEMPPKPEGSVPIVQTQRYASSTTATLGKDNIITIRFHYDPTRVAAVKTIPGRKFQNDSTGKYWTAPLSMDAVGTLGKAGFELDESLIQYYEENSRFNPETVEPIDVPSLKRNLFPFQQEGVGFIEARGGRALVADEMGLGKTIQALAWLQLHPEKRPAVVLCPAHLKLNWEREVDLNLTTGDRVQVIQGTNKDVPLDGDIIIINYDVLGNKSTMVRDNFNRMGRVESPHTGWVDYLIDIQPSVLIMDEAHYIKNPKSNRSVAATKLAAAAEHVIALTGTPMVNRPIEGYPIIKAIDPTIFPDFWSYAQRYCGATHNGFGWDFGGATNKDELHTKLTHRVMVRRKKQDVLRDLPPKLFAHIPIELDNRSEYDRIHDDFIDYLGGSQTQSGAEHLVRIERLKQCAVAGKLNAAIEWISNFLDEGDDKLVVFTTHRATVDRLMDEFGDIAVMVQGGMSTRERDSAVQAFQDDPEVGLFVGNIQAAGTGLTLTAASNVAFLELPWTPGELVQAEDRCHRIGQEDTVNVWYLLAEDTVDEDIAELLDKKRVVIDAIIDGKTVQDTPLVTELLDTYRARVKKHAT